MAHIVSIIIPFFNAEKTLERCINSIVQQSYETLDIILINDGSTDHSEIVARRFSRHDKRIRLINQTNSGVSVARNHGMNLARGKYIQFVDADDYINPEMTINLVKNMNEERDLVICGFQKIEQWGRKQLTTIYKPYTEGFFSQKTVIKQIGKLYKATILQSPCNKLYRTHTIKQHGIKFKPHLQLGEDLLFNLDYLAASETISIIKDKLYYYTTDQTDSLSKQFIDDYLVQQVSLHTTFTNFLQKHNAYCDENKRMIDQQFTEHIIYSMALVCDPNNPNSPAGKRAELRTIISKPIVQQHLSLFPNNLQSRVVSYLLRKKSHNLLYYFFRMKYSLRQKALPLFNYLKWVNDSLMKGSNI